MMTSSTVVAFSAKAFRRACSIVLSPFGYAKELAGFAAFLSLAAWVLNASCSAILEDERQAAAAAQPSISRLTLLPATGGIGLFRDVSEIVIVDDQTGDELFRHSAPCLQQIELGGDDAAWSHVTLACDGTLKWWHSDVGAVELPELRGAASRGDLTLSDDGRAFAIHVNSDDLLRWTISETGQLAASQGKTIPGTDQIWLSPAGNRLAVKTCENSLALLDAAEGTVLLKPQPLNSPVMAVAWSADETRFAVGLENRLIFVWNAAAPESPPRRISLEGLPASVALSADGRWLIAGMSTGELRAWRDEQPVWTQAAHPASIRSLDISQQEPIIVSGCLQGRLKFHDLETGELRNELRTVDR